MLVERLAWFPELRIKGHLGFIAASIVLRHRFGYCVRFTPVQSTGSRARGAGCRSRWRRAASNQPPVKLCNAKAGWRLYGSSSWAVSCWTTVRPRLERAADDLRLGADVLVSLLLEGLWRSAILKGSSVAWAKQRDAIKVSFPCGSDTWPIWGSTWPALYSHENYSIYIYTANAWVLPGPAMTTGDASSSSSSTSSSSTSSNPYWRSSMNVEV